MLKNKSLTDFIYISFVQGLNYLVPLLLTPYIVRKLGPENFGVVSFSQSFAQYFTLLINFGFDLSAVREMTRIGNENDRSRLFSNVFCAKLVLFIIGTLIFIVLSTNVDQLSEYFLLNLFCFLINVGFLFYPSWFFQAVGKMKVAVIFNCVFKLLMALAVFLFVRSDANFLEYALIFSGAQVLLGVSSFLFVVKRYAFRIRLSIAGVLKQIRMSAVIFVSSIMITLYTNTNVFLLGLFSSHEATGYFASASKLIYGAIYLIFVPFSLILYPKVSAAMNESEAKGIQMLKKATWIALFLGLSLSLFLFLGSSIIIKVVYGEQFLRSIIDFRILSALPLLLALSNIFVTQGMLNLKMDKLFLVLTVFGAVLCLVINYIFIPLYHDMAASYALVVTEAFISVAGFIMIRNRIGNVFDLNYLKMGYVLIKSILISKYESIQSKYVIK